MEISELPERLRDAVRATPSDDVDAAMAVTRLVEAEMGAVPGCVTYYLLMLQRDKTELQERLRAVKTIFDPGAR